LSCRLLFLLRLISFSRGNKEKEKPSVLQQCVAAVRCSSVLKYVAVCCSVLRCVAVRCSVLECVAVCLLHLRLISFSGPKKKKKLDVTPYDEERSTLYMNASRHTYENLKICVIHIPLSLFLFYLSHSLSSISLTHTYIVTYTSLSDSLSSVPLSQTSCYSF